MARIPYLNEDGATADQKAVLDARREVFGRTSAFQRIVTRTPKVAQWFIPFSYALQRGDCGGLLDGRTKELAIIKTSLVNACSFCAAHNVSLGRAVGIGAAEVDALSGDYMSSPILSARDKAVIRWAESVTRNEGRRDQVGFDMLRAHFTDDEIVELTWVIGLFNMVNRITDTLWLDLEESDLTGIQRPITREQILRYVRRILAHEESSGSADGDRSSLKGKGS